MSNVWEVIGLILGIMAAWTGILILTMKVLLKQSIKSLCLQIDELKNIPKEHIKLEKALLELKADLPLSYVRREDFIRFDTVINVKLDRLRDLIEAIREKR